MSVKKFYGAKFDDEHEVEQYREVRNLIEELYGDREEPVYLLFNVQLKSQIDLIILKSDLIVILELKSLKGKINGSENGNWSVTTDSGEKKQIGNLYKQLRRHKFGLTNTLKDALYEDIYNIQGWGYFKNGSSYDKSQITSKNQLKWFDIVWKDTLTPKLVGAEKSGFELAEGDIETFINSLNLNSADYLELEENLSDAGEEYLKSNFALVLEHADKALKIDQETVRAWNYVCIGLMGLGEFKDAEKAIDNALYFDRSHASALYNKGVILFKNQEFEATLEIFKEFIEISNELKYNNKPPDGKEFFLDNKMDRKEFDLKNAVASAWEYKGDCYFDRVESLKDVALLEKAIEFYDRAIELDPISVDLIQKKCLASYYYCDDNKALECIDKILELVPEFAPAWYNKGLILAPDEMKESIKCFDEFLNKIEAEPNRDDTFLEAKNFLENGRVINRDGALNDIVSDAWYQKGWVNRELKNFKEAISCFDKALEVNPQLGKKTDLWRLKAFCHEETGDIDEALKCHDKALKNTKDEKKSSLWRWKGKCYEKIKDFDSALRCYDKGIKFSPGDDFVAALNWYDKGLLLEKLGKTDEAKYCKDKAKSLEKNIESFF